MGQALDDAALDRLFRGARSHNAWQDRDIADETLVALADMVKMGPTSANSSPARLVFVKSAAAKARLRPHLDAGNRDKTMSAPVCAIIGWDTRFYEHLGRLFPHNKAARGWFEGKPEAIEETAFRNSTLQGAYLILAARALGLDCGPMSGFDRAGVDATFFPDGRVRSNFLCALGHGDASVLFPRSPRFDFDDFCVIA